VNHIQLNVQIIMVSLLQPTYLVLLNLINVNNMMQLNIALLQQIQYLRVGKDVHISIQGIELYHHVIIKLLLINMLNINVYQQIRKLFHQILHVQLMVLKFQYKLIVEVVFKIMIIQISKE
jgi:hypothetical protein